MVEKAPLSTINPKKRKTNNKLKTPHKYSDMDAYLKFLYRQPAPE